MHKFYMEGLKLTPTMCLAVYMSAMGLSLSQTLSAADAYGKYFADYSRYTKPMSPDYSNIPQANVYNITQGYKDEKNGTLCQ